MHDSRAARPPVFVRADERCSVADARALSFPFNAVLPGAVAVALVCILSIHPRRVPPLVESDYCYLLTAADRFHQGLGLTTTPPVAPLQPWEWQADWTFLTKWPVGYSILIATIRDLLGGSSLQAAGLICAICAAASLSGWYLLTRRIAPVGWLGRLLAAVTAASTVSIPALTNPSTDFMVTAALPWLLLAILHDREDEPGSGTWKCRWAAVGLAAGFLFWIRYASIAVPLAMGMYLFIQWPMRKRKPCDVFVFGCAALLPVLALLFINRIYGRQALTAEQLNLGHTIDFQFSWTLLWKAWWRFTDLGFYDYHWFMHWLFALWPVLLALVLLILRSELARLARRGTSNPMLLSAIVVVSTLIMLIAVTTFFGTKFHYLGLDRYYQPIRPFYFILFGAPLLLWRNRVWHAAIAVCLLILGFWIATQEWTRPIRQAAGAKEQATPYGARPVCFGKDAGALYDWLQQQNSHGLVVASNFHEFIELETGIPAIPIPADRATLDRWLSAIRSARGAQDLRVLFVLDPHNKWRDYWIENPRVVITKLGLELAEPGFRDVRLYSYEPESDWNGGRIGDSSRSLPAAAGSE